MYLLTYLSMGILNMMSITLILSIKIGFIIIIISVVKELKTQRTEVSLS